MAHVRATFVGRTDSSNSLDDTWNEATPIVDDLLPMDENLCVNVMKACMALTKFSTLKDVYRGMVARRVARSAGFGLAIRYCHKHLDARFLEEVLDDVFATEQALGGQWMLEVANYNDALGCFATTRRSRQAREVFAHMLQNPLIVPDHITMLEMVENHRDASIEDLFDLLDVFLARKLVPNVQVLTSLLSICMRRRVVGDALALIDAMKQQHVVLDVKVYTTIAFIHASQGDLLAVVQVVKEMTSHDVAVDDIFFDYVVNAVYGSCGLDMCFSLLHEFSRQDLPVPEGLYRSLVALGIDVGVLERTLHVAFTSSSRWTPREALGTHKTSDPPRFSGKPKLFDRERFKSSVLPPSAVIKDHAEPRRALYFQATTRSGEEPLDAHERHDDTLASVLASFMMRFIKAARSRTQGGPAWSDKVDDDDEMDARGDTNTAKGGRADGTRRLRGGSSRLSRHNGASRPGPASRASPCAKEVDEGRGHKGPVSPSSSTGTVCS
ncbi:hypothetical protein PsorP6_006249 [Peronosclerospora sorghi]|uniref:Uncharacterized protein n=1 Tax=Peronosclerospora sorghi TaxID=230839 RepID=A0ACC0W122_9STRA|nr:hypothetical protein PsorP6_006249 [Peronosclerospora sorghi]